jgi:glutaredoxin-dependent peroxiredoxin
MALATGTQAPEFTLKSKQSDGLHDVSLSSQLGQKSVLLLFFPLAFTGVCTDELCSVSGGLSDYDDLGAVVYGISVDSPFAQEAFAEKAGINFLLLSDFNKEVSAAYDVLYGEFLPGKLGFQGVAKRSAFVVNKEGIITYAWSSDDPGKVPPFDEVKAALQAG